MHTNMLGSRNGQFSDNTSLRPGSYAAASIQLQPSHRALLAYPTGAANVDLTSSQYQTWRLVSMSAHPGTII